MAIQIKIEIGYTPHHRQKVSPLEKEHSFTKPTLDCVTTFLSGIWIKRVRRG